MSTLAQLMHTMASVLCLQLVTAQQACNSYCQSGEQVWQLSQTKEYTIKKMSSESLSNCYLVLNCLPKISSLHLELHSPNENRMEPAPSHITAVAQPEC